MSQPPIACDHYTDRYWNDLTEVDRYIRRLSTGDPALFWMDYFKLTYAQVPRERALVIGCGNGWVERWMDDRKIATYFDAFDASPRYLEEAAGQRGERPISYAKADFNTWLPERRYDLIVNVAALHHVRYLFRMAHLLSNALDAGGLFVHFEYIGPSRNQYSEEHVALMRGINASLPERFRTKHSLVPSLRGILDTDPTEAIHSSNIMRALEDFFEPIERKMLGGGVAYQLLWNNIAEFEKGDEEAKATLDSILRLDEALTAQGVVPPLFAFLVYGSRKRKPSLSAHVDRRVREPLRERFADLTGGLYPREFLRAKFPRLALRR
jgi:hypothetical protein